VKLLSVGEEVVRLSVRVVLGCALFLLFTPTARAAGPILVDPTAAKPISWDSTKPVVYNLDLGRLNTDIDSAGAAQIVAQAFRNWTSLAGVSLTVTRGADLSADVTDANIKTFIDTRDGISPIVYDETGKITDQILGQGASEVVLGFAAPEFTKDGTSTIVEGFACLNGRAMQGTPVEEILNLCTHEFGHMLGVGHADLNGDLIDDGDAANNAFIPVMYPILRSSSPDNPKLPATPTLDDEVAMGFLYPSNTYATRGGSITGKVTKSGAEFRGANVVVRNKSDPLRTAVTWPSGGGTLTGAPWEVHLLPAGEYTVKVEPIDASFTGGSSVGPFDPPPSGVAPEFFNGPNENGDPTLDDPSESTGVSAAVAGTVGDVNIVLNETSLALNPGAESSGTITKTGTIFDTNAALPAYQFEIPVGAGDALLALTVKQTNGQPVDCYLRNGTAVTFASGVFASDASVTGNEDSKALTLSKFSSPQLKSGTYFVALVNRGAAAANYQLTASFSSTSAATSAGTSSGGGSGCAMHRPGPIDEDWESLVLMLLPLAFALSLRRR
jgi:hypothetical protein